MNQINTICHTEGGKSDAHTELNIQHNPKFEGMCWWCELIKSIQSLITVLKPRSGEQHVGGGGAEHLTYAPEGSLFMQTSSIFFVPHFFWVWARVEGELQFTESPPPQSQELIQTRSLHRGTSSQHPRSASLHGLKIYSRSTMQSSPSWRSRWGRCLISGYLIWQKGKKSFGLSFLWKCSIVNM